MGITILSERHYSLFSTLQPSEAQFVWDKVSRRWPDDTRIIESPPADGEELFEDCQLCGLDQCRVVLSLADLNGAPTRTVIEKLIGRPILPWAASVEAKLGLRQPASAPCEGCDTPLPASPPAMHKRPPASRKADTRVVLAVAPNPHRPGSKMFDSYLEWREGDTVQACRDRGVIRMAVRRDVRRGFVKIGAPK